MESTPQAHTYKGHRGRPVGKKREGFEDLMMKSKTHQACNIRADGLTSSGPL